jgi:dienelactone hydrolase
MAGLPLRRALGAILVAATLAGRLTAHAAIGPEGSMVTTAPDGAVERIPVTIVRPDGPGPFPAVVILHDCSGLGPRSSGAPERWSRELVARGYVVVIPDSFDSERPVRFVASRVNMNAPGGRGATTGGDPWAWADSIRRVAEFFERTLG